MDLLAEIRLTKTIGKLYVGYLSTEGWAQETLVSTLTPRPLAGAEGDVVRVGLSFVGYAWERAGWLSPGQKFDLVDGRTVANGVVLELLRLGLMPRARWYLEQAMFYDPKSITYWYDPHSPEHVDGFPLQGEPLMRLWYYPWNNPHLSWRSWILLTNGKAAIITWSRAKDDAALIAYAKGGGPKVVRPSISVRIADTRNIEMPSLLDLSLVPGRTIPQYQHGWGESSQDQYGVESYGLRIAWWGQPCDELKPLAETASNLRAQIDALFEDNAN